MTPVDVLSEDAPFDLLLSDEEFEVHREHITTFIEGTVETAGADGAIIGLSGGIDPTLTVFLVVEAPGKESLRRLVMPSVADDEDMMSDAEGIARMLGIEYDAVETQPIAETFFDTLPEAVDDRMAAGNVYICTRAVLNYFAVNYENHIVLETGSRAEAMTGYFTKYGDRAADCNPIGNLYKQQVHQLVTHVGVPEDLALQTPPVEMWSGQTDEGELGLTYDALDAILALYADGPLSESATARRLGVTEEQVDRVVGLVEGSVHKRSMPSALSAFDVQAAAALPTN